MMLDAERERLIAEIESDPLHREWLRRILLEQDRALTGPNVIAAAHRFRRTREVLTSLDELVDQLSALGLEKTMDIDDEREPFSSLAYDELVKLSAMTPNDSPEYEAALVRWFFTRPQVERQEVYDTVNKLYELLFASFKKHFPEREPTEFWSDAPRNDDTMRAYLATLEANVA